MKDSDYIIIDTPELKAMFAPKQATDEVNHNNEGWHGVTDDREWSTWTASHYRRLRSRAWLPAKGKTYPWDDAPLWLLHNNGSRRWVERWRIGMQGNFTHWQPAPSAPEPPTNPDEDWAQQWVEQEIVRTLPWPTKVIIKNAIKAALDYERSKVKAGEGKS